MASPSGSDGAPKGEDLQFSSSSSTPTSTSTSTSRSSIHTTMKTKLQNAKRLSIQYLEDITDNFSQERMIGQGGFGTVYRGVEGNGANIAVKVLKKDPTGIDDGKFKHEFENLMRLEHPNIVRIVGYCYETQHKPRLHKGETIFAEDTYKALCLEYMPSGSLKKYISEEYDGLGWHTRYRIIKGTCEGLKYLHEEFKEPVYHLDLKPDNILLADNNMMPKLADFGSSKLFGKEQSVVIGQNFVATLGYMPPEYINEQIVSKKYDIFSLGVVMSKIIAGPKGNSRSAEMPYQEFLDQVNENWRNRLKETCHAFQPLEAYCQQVNICISIALSCMNNDRHKRPRIVDIIHKLNETETMLEGVEPNYRWISEHSTVGNKSKKDTSWSEVTIRGPITIFTVQVLQDITNNFSEERALGQGSYGKVYKGVYHNGEEVAVKLLHNNMQYIDNEQFKNGIEKFMMFNHPNIVKLVGYCHETQLVGYSYGYEITYRALCFEYMPMGSLQSHLCDEFSGLDWQTRYKIIKGACEVLKYLHEGFEEPIYHMDIKPENILLDKNMTPKLKDFGFSKMFGKEQTRFTHNIVGTFGYLPPEYLFRNVISKKLDVFSLGVVITKIIAGPRGNTMNDEMGHQEFLDQVCENWRNRLEVTCTSSRTLEAYCEQVSICVKIGLSSMETDRHKRPSILDIIDRLDVTESTIQKALQWSESMHPWMLEDLVKLESFTKCEAIRSVEACNEFPVLLRITGAPWHGVEEMPRAGVDVVVVVEVDWSMVLQWRLNMIKQALMVVIDKLGTDDRLSILSFKGNVPRIMNLKFMTKQGRDVAKRMVNELTVDHGYNIIAALREAAKILRGREIKGGNSRVGCMMFLSDNNDIRIKDRHDKEISSEFPAHVFGLGELHHPEVMKYIADRTRGTYSFVHYDINEMKNAFELFITGLTKVVATSVKITLRAHEGVSISSIYSGGYDSRVNSDKRSGEIDVDNMYAGERKNFIAYLKVPEGNEDASISSIYSGHVMSDKRSGEVDVDNMYTGERKKIIAYLKVPAERLLTVGGRYQSLISRRKLADTDVAVLRRPSLPSLPGNPATDIHPEVVAAELVRIQLRKGMVIMSRDPDALEQLWVSVKCSEEGGGTPEETLSELGNDVAEIKRVLTHNRSPPYMMSWLTCHWWQRATTKGARCVSGAFAVPGQHEDADAKDDGHAQSK